MNRETLSQLAVSRPLGMHGPSSCRKRKNESDRFQKVTASKRRLHGDEKKLHVTSFRDYR
jgi:hypothetical protein